MRDMHHKAGKDVQWASFIGIRVGECRRYGSKVTSRTLSGYSYNAEITY